MSDVLDWGIKTLSTRLAGSLCYRDVGTFTSTEGLLFSRPARQSNTKASWLLCSNFVALKMTKHDFVHYSRLPSFSLIKLISRWKKYPVPHKVSATHQASLPEPQGVVSTEWAKCLRLCCFGFTAAFLLSASLTVAGSFCVSFLLPLSLVLF